MLPHLKWSLASAVPISILGAAIHADSSNRLNFHRRFLPGDDDNASLPNPDPLHGVKNTFEESPVSDGCACAEAAAVDADTGDDTTAAGGGRTSEWRKSDLRDASSLKLREMRQMPKSCKPTELTSTVHC